MDKPLENLQQLTLLNGICAYFTMFPLKFPYSVLKDEANTGDLVLDPFCGRGTTNFASRLLGLNSIGIDSHPLALALSRAKLLSTTPEQICEAASRILEEITDPQVVPEGEFWDWAYHPETLGELCRLREGLLTNSRQLSPSQQALLAVILGALHGPLMKTTFSYFSNQMPRTYSPKPRYSVNYWKSRNMVPPKVRVLDLIRKRAYRYFSQGILPVVDQGQVIEGDSREASVYGQLSSKVNWVITSPPYYGMRTYFPDQWLRLWFLGGVAQVNYSNDRQLNHGSPDQFSNDLKKVWQNAGSVAADKANLIIRFGGINERKANPMEILRNSLKDSGWKIVSVKTAGIASEGRRQANHFTKTKNPAIEEHDLRAVWTE